MEAVGALLVIGGVLVFLGGVLWLVVTVFRKRGAKTPALVTTGAVVAFICGGLLLPSEATNEGGSAASPPAESQIPVPPLPTPTPNLAATPWIDWPQQERRSRALETYTQRDVLHLATDSALKYREFGELFGPEFLQQTVTTTEGAIGWSYRDEGYEWELTPIYVASTCNLLLAHGTTVQDMDRLLGLTDFKGAATLGAIIGGLSFDPRSIEIYCLEQQPLLQSPNG